MASTIYIVVCDQCGTLGYGDESILSKKFETKALAMQAASCHNELGSEHVMTVEILRARRNRVIS